MIAVTEDRIRPEHLVQAVVVDIRDRQLVGVDTTVSARIFGLPESGEGPSIVDVDTRPERITRRDDLQLPVAVEVIEVQMYAFGMDSVTARMVPSSSKR